MNLKETKSGILLSIFVKPNSSEFKIEHDGDEIVVYATEVPEKGKVNKEIIKEFRRISGFDAEIVSGQTSRQKVLLFREAKIEVIESALEKLFK